MTGNTLLWNTQTDRYNPKRDFWDHMRWRHITHLHGWQATLSMFQWQACIIWRAAITHVITLTHVRTRQGRWWRGTDVCLSQRQRRARPTRHQVSDKDISRSIRVTISLVNPFIHSFINCDGKSVKYTDCNLWYFVPKSISWRNCSFIYHTGNKTWSWVRDGTSCMPRYMSHVVLDVITPFLRMMIKRVIKRQTFQRK